MKRLLFISLIFLNLSCSNDSIDPDPREIIDDSAVSGFVLKASVEFSILNENGDDLLNPISDRHFPVEDMKLFHLLGDQKVEIYDTLMDCPRGIQLISETKPYRLRVLTPDNRNEYTYEKDGIKYGRATTYLELNGSITDTLLTEWEYLEKQCFVNRKAWYNGEYHEESSLVFIVIK